eukprot:gnl/Hemi2/7737_TR2666_c0_g1_i1.p1 gnl/Hemi2/7737_TR2666_c0_g1~~gnl/Hemi2/7737_TR2666_c0_g1_i1.p1  ORF type:complete len:376 (+),score=87.32 gnl/Hemi2/7737_TR2666_c0_g1_i1:114-1241(+)
MSIFDIFFVNPLGPGWFGQRCWCVLRPMSVLSNVAINTLAMARVVVLGLFKWFLQWLPGACQDAAYERVDMRGKVAIVTGSNAGIGYHTALELARRGASVIMACRTEARCTPVIQAIIQETGNNDVRFMALDLSSLSSVRTFCEEYRASQRPLHLLVNNAGVMLQGFSRSFTSEGHEIQFGTNYLGHWLLTLLLVDVLARSSIASGTSARVVNLTSVAHLHAMLDLSDINMTLGYFGGMAYANSKLCSILFTYELQRRLNALCSEGQRSPISVYAVHPGVVQTEMTAVGSSAVRFLMRLAAKLKFVLSAEDGAKNTLFACMEPSLAGGIYIDNFKSAQSSAASHDARLAADLWALSEQLTGLRPDLKSVFSTGFS